MSAMESRDLTEPAPTFTVAMQELREQFLLGCQAYDVDHVAYGSTDDEGNRLPLDEAGVRRICSATPTSSILEQAPDEIDLEVDMRRGTGETDASMWARTSLGTFLTLIAHVPAEAVATVGYKFTSSHPSHLVVFGPHNFHLCSCLQLLRRGLPCRHYFAVVVKLRDRQSKSGDAALPHEFDSACVHNRWRQRNDGQDAPWSVQAVLASSGHGEGWDGHHFGGDESGGGPTLDDNEDGVHPSEPAVEKRTLRAQADERRLFANIMAAHKEDTKALLSSVKSKAQIMAIHEQGRAFVASLVQLANRAPGPGNPAKPPQKGRPKGSGNKPKSTTGLKDKNKGGGNVKVKEKVANPEGHVGNSKRTKRRRDSIETRGPRRRQRPKTDAPRPG